MDTHAFIPPVDLLFCRAQFCAATRICALLKHHPLYLLVCKAASRLIRSHRSPLHYLFHLAGVKPQLVKTISPSSLCSPTYKPALKTTISVNKESTFWNAISAHNLTCYKVYCNGSGYKNGASASAVLYKGNIPIKTLLLHVGRISEHTVYETKLISILLALHLLSSLACLLTSFTAAIGLDNQAAIKALHIQKAKPTQYLLDQIHNSVENLHAKQDCLKRKAEFQKAKWHNAPIKAKVRGVIDLHIHWVPSHINFEPNERAKKVVLGESSPAKDLPAFLCKPLPLSISALHQESKTKIHRLWSRHWKNSPRYTNMFWLNKSTPSNKWLVSVQPLNCKEASVIR